MRNFSAYLRDIHKTYDFKVKVAGELKPEAKDVIQSAVSQFKVESCSAGKRLPIAEQLVDFPTLTNQNVTIFDVSVAYPTTTQVIRTLVAEKLKLPLEYVKVRSPMEEAEQELNHEYDEPTGKSKLTDPTLEAQPDGQSLVGNARTMSLLRELGKQSHTAEQFTGINDEILAKGMPKHEKETPAKQPMKFNPKSPINANAGLKPVRTGK